MCFVILVTAVIFHVDEKNDDIFEVEMLKGVYEFGLSVYLAIRCALNRLNILRLSFHFYELLSFIMEFSAMD